MCGDDPSFNYWERVVFKTEEAALDYVRAQVMRRMQE